MLAYSAGPALGNCLQTKQVSMQRLQPRNAGGLVVRAAAGPGMRSFDAPSSSSSNGSVPSTSGTVVVGSSSVSMASTVEAPAAPRSYRVSMWDAMKFTTGAVPECANGRIAMLALLYIAQREVETGLTVIQQAQQLPTTLSVWPFVALLLLFVAATFPPALAGSKEEDFGIFSVAAEKTNGRAAMLGLAVLAALEWHSGFCFF